MNLRWKFSKIALMTVLVAVTTLAGTASLALTQESNLPSSPVVVPTAQMPDGTSTRGGTLTADNVDNPKTFNPIVQSEASSSAVTSLTNAALIDETGTATVAQGVTVSADQTRVTVTLREGLKFSGGEPLTAADVVFTLEDVVFNPLIPSTQRDAWRINGQFPSVEAPDDMTVVIASPVPFSGMLSALASTPILPQHLLQDAVQNGNFASAWDISTDPEQIAGLGPFRLAGFTPDQQVVLERNPYYWKVDQDGTQLPYLDRIVMPITTDNNVRTLRFTNGQTDVYAPRPEDVPVLRQQSNVSVRVQQAGTVDMNTIAFNQDTSDPQLRQLFRDVRFRQAMAYAANREAMISANLNGLGESRYGPGIASEFWIQDQSGFPSFAFNLDRANELLDEIGVAMGDDGFRHFDNGDVVEFTLLTNQGSTVLTNDAVLFADTLEQVGIKVNVRPVELNALINQILSGDPPPYEAARVTITGGSGDPNLLRSVFGSSGSLHFWKFSDAEGQNVPNWQQDVDRLLSQQAQSLDFSQRADLLAEFQEIVAQNQPVIFLYNAQGLEAYRSDRIGNFTGTVEGATLLNPELLFRK